MICLPSEEVNEKIVVQVETNSLFLSVSRKCEKSDAMAKDILILEYKLRMGDVEISTN